MVQTPISFYGPKHIWERIRNWPLLDQSPPLAWEKWRLIEMTIDYEWMFVSVCKCVRAFARVCVWLIEHECDFESACDSLRVSARLILRFCLNGLDWISMLLFWMCIESVSKVFWKRRFQKLVAPVSSFINHVYQWINELMNESTIGEEDVMPKISVLDC